MAGRVLITGASGQLGGYLLRELAAQGIPAAAWSHTREGRLFGVPLQLVDLANPDAIALAFHGANPSTVIHAAAVATVADCARDPARAETVNVRGSATLAELADRARVRLVLVSTDLVFDGEHAPYREGDDPAPLSAYGRSKAAAERAVLALPRHAAVRLSLLFGPSLSGRPAFFDNQIAALRAGRPVRLFHDEWRTPLALPAAAQALVALARSSFTGLLHLGGPERLSRLEMGQRLAAGLGLSPATIVPASRTDQPGPEPRPRDTSLDSSRWRGLFPGLPWPTFADALRQMAAE
jgi:dTDP-4-dehydrorhamnose reductase